MSDNTMDYPTRDTSLVGAAGVHAVVSELSLRGLIALPTIRNTAGVDVIVANKAGTWHANLQVKTSRSRVGFWPIGKKYSDWVGPNKFYVFLRFNKKKNSSRSALSLQRRSQRTALPDSRGRKKRAIRNGLHASISKAVLRNLGHNGRNSPTMASKWTRRVCRAVDACRYFLSIENLQSLLLPDNHSL